ncbi:hypothetical protein MAPG_09963, partial [Magnaporthiopsis poae ATCC 64411]
MAAAFTEADDPYAADGEGSNLQHRRPPRTSSRARDAASLPANRLRQRPTTKHAAASDVPGQPHSPGGGRHYPYHRTRDDDDQHALANKSSDLPPQLPPLPLTPSSPRWDSLTSGINKTIAAHDHAQSYQYQFRHTSRHQTFHQLPSPAKTNSGSSSPITSTNQALAAVLSAAVPVSPVSPSRNYPYPSPNGHRSALLEQEQDRIVSFAPPPPSKFHATSLAANQPPVRTSSRGALSRSSSRRLGDEQQPPVMVENFSRPRKPSVARPNVAPPMPPAAAHPAQYDDDSPILNRQLANWPRQRGPSVSSNRSNGTMSSIPGRPSTDIPNASSRIVPRTLTANAAAPPSAGGGMISPGLPKPKLAYTRVDGAGPSLPLNPRDGAAPWMAEQEPRSSYRSQLTSSTAPVTVFSGPNTQRSSVATKTSSRTSSSMYNFTSGPAADEGGMSVEDVMGLYEKGFADSTGAEDNDVEGAPGTRGHTRKVSSSKSSARSRSSSRANHDRSQSHVGHRIREAMTDSLPMPTKPRGASDPPPAVTVRDSMSFFSGSALPQSVSEDGRSEREPRPSIASRGRPSHEEEVDDSAKSKHDSAKLLESDETAGPRMGHSRQISAASSVAPRLAMSSPDLTQTTFDTKAAPPLPTTPSQSQQLYSAPTEDEPDSRDRYGFRKSNQYVSREQYDTWDATYTEYLARRKKKWVAYLRDSGLMTEEPDRFPAPSAKTKRFIRKGIPPEWRGAAWFYYARGPSILAKHPGVYDELIARSKRPGESKEVDVEAIERDLHRTFPDNAKFRFSTSEPEGSGNNGTAKDGGEEPRIISSLRRVLHAFAIYNPQIGYCQSLNFLAGLLLLFVETEEQAFWLLNVITRVHLPGTHELSLEGSKVDLGVLMGAVKDSMPNVWNKVGSELDTVEARPATQGTGAK